MEPLPDFAAPEPREWLIPAVRVVFGTLLLAMAGFSFSYGLAWAATRFDLEHALCVDNPGCWPRYCAQDNSCDHVELPDLIEKRLQEATE